MNSFLETLRQFGAARLTILAAIVLGLLLFFVFVMLQVSQPGLKVLYTELAPNDSSAIAGVLEEAGIPYEVSPDGAQVKVSGGAVGRARMLLAERGLPDGGSLGYELFDERTGFGTTAFVQNINQVRALEGELARTIMGMEAVRTARVQLVLPKRELFGREPVRAKASVMLDLRPGARLEPSQAAAVQALVSAAVPDLKSDAVTVVLSNGVLVAGGAPEGEGAVAALRAHDLQRTQEDRLERKIEDIVGRVVGFDKVRAIVTAEMNFDRVSLEEELYDPAGQVVRSAQVTEETGKETQAPRVEVSVANNLPGLGDEGAGDGPPLPGAENARTSEVTNFEISRTVRSVLSEGGAIERLSISVLVDGRYTPAPAGEGEGGTAGEMVYEPRSDEEMARIESLVRAAVGFDPDRGDIIEVINDRFPTLSLSDMVEEEPTLLERLMSDEMQETVGNLVLAGAAILVVLLIVQPMISRLISAEMGPSDDEAFDTELLAAQTMPVLPPPEEAVPEEQEEEESLINIAGVEGKVKASALKKVEEIVQNYPNEAVSVIRSWMTDTRGD
jgi:flagellar M-ring protein FliF